MSSISRRTFLATSAAAGLSAAGPARAQRAATDTGPPPNILFAMADDWSWPHASAYGAPEIHTPNFDRVAEHGCLFNNAFVCAPQCSPNRACILTGRHIWELEQAGSHFGLFPIAHNVFPDTLARAGYHTGYTTKGWSPGDWQGSGWEHNPAGPDYNEKKNERPTDSINRSDYAGNFEAFLNDKPDGAPFCFWYGCTEPHRRYEQGTGKAAGKNPDNVEVPPFMPDDALIREDMLDYFVEIEWFDTHLGRMLDMLDERGLLNNTIVVVAGDNGMPFPGAKANVYEHGIHVPLAIAWPDRMEGGQVCDDLISFADFAPTFLDAAGLRPDPVMSGQSFYGLLTGDGEYAPREYILTGLERHSHARMHHVGYPMRAIRTAGHLYIRNFTPDRWPAGDPPWYYDIDDCPSKQYMIAMQDVYPDLFQRCFGKRPDEELFDIKTDPGCLTNMVESTLFAHARDRMRDTLNGELTRMGDPRMEGRGDVFESYPYFGGLKTELKGTAERGEYNPRFM